MSRIINLYEEERVITNKLSQQKVYDLVRKPKHYNVLGDTQAIEIIARSMTTEQFYGFCLGSILGYRLRVGCKENNPIQQDVAKAIEFKELYEKYKGLCYDNKTTE